MKEIYSNINIIGGGMVGTILAYSLSQHDIEITILEKKSTFKPSKHTDKRTTAISEGTKNFLDKIFLWSEIKKYCEPIKKIKVINRKKSNQIVFDNNRRKSNLGYIVKNSDLLKVLYNKLRKRKNIKILNNIDIIDFQNEKEKIITKCKNIKIYSNLNIAADGKKSFVKKFYKTNFYSKDYNKKAMVLTFTHSKNHNGAAFEFFYKNGPLAILPMKKYKNDFCSSLIWTNDNTYLENLMNIDINSLTKILNIETQNCIGNFKQIISKQIFPLTAHLNSKFYEKRTIYLGDSAHSFHPIAGQGWNLGIGDVKSLLELVLQYKSLGIEVGDSFFCKKYHNDNFYRAYRLYQITDKLDSIFQVQNTIFNYGRSSGINYINNNKKFKNFISDFAMGIN